MTFPAPTRKHHQRFCLTEGWVQRRSSRGKTGTHHVNYEFTLPDGRVLLTRISHPVNRDTYGPRIWSHILRDQLAVTEGEFWDCVNDSVLPNRGAEPAVAPASAIPLVSTAECTSYRRHSSSRARRNLGCASGSPPVNVTPPPDWS